MKITILIFFLNIESSYIQASETTVDGYGDTVQWVIREDMMWRIRTFAVDEDVHVYQIDRRGKTRDALIEIASQNTLKHYRETITDELLINSETGVAGILEQLKAEGIDSRLNEDVSGLVFWSPDGSKYSTKSEPK